MGLESGFADNVQVDGLFSGHDVSSSKSSSSKLRPSGSDFGWPGPLRGVGLFIFQLFFSVLGLGMSLFSQFVICKELANN